MKLDFVDASTLFNSFMAAAKNLEAKKEWINELNVFPVPDGDTGTNMTLTIMSAVSEVKKIDEINMENLCRAISSGSLRGARGNSGVILSQLLRGVTRTIKDKQFINAADLSLAFARATETAYKAVMKPKEGTILTVAKSMCDKAAELAAADENMDILSFMKSVIACGDETLAKTPDMLPVLKQAGVEDSGGQGLMQLMKGVLLGLEGKIPEDFDFSEADNYIKDSIDKSSLTTSDIKFGYCTEFIIETQSGEHSKEENELKKYFETIGDSIVVVADDEIIKVHVHTNNPGLAIEKALTIGALSHLKIDNMRIEHRELIFTDNKYESGEEKETEQKDVGFISIVSGNGLEEIFKGIGTDYIINGGQTMNPSTEDILNAAKHVNADTIFVFPNNSNVILAANQAANLIEDKHIIVIPSKTIPQGITALINYVPDMTPEENSANMTQELKHVKSAQITYAVRDTKISGVDIHKGDIIAIDDDGLICAAKTAAKGVIEALKKLTDAETELVSIYYGSDISDDEADKLKDMIIKSYPNIEIDFLSGGQPVYYYIISVE